MGYIGVDIIGITSPTIGNDKTTFTTDFDASFAVIDTHDHSNSKGTQVPTGGIVDGAITAAKIGSTAVTGSKLDTTAADATTLEVASGSMRIKDLGVSTAKIAALAVSKDKLAALGQISSSSTSGYTSSSLTPSNAATVNITVVSRPVMLMVVPDGSSTAFINLTATAGIEGYIRVTRDGVNIGQTKIASSNHVSPTLLFFDTPGAGAHTYLLQGFVSDVAGTLAITSMVLVAVEFG